MPGITLGEETRIVGVLPPKDLGGAAAVGDAFFMGKYTHASIIIVTGVVTNASAITVKASTDAAEAGAEAIPFSYRETPTVSDILGAKKTVANTGFTSTTENALIFVIEIDARQLPTGKGWVTVNFGSAAAALVACVAVLTGAKNQGAVMPTAIA